MRSAQFDRREEKAGGSVHSIRYANSLRSRMRPRLYQAGAVPAVAEMACKRVFRIDVGQLRTVQHEG